jgi:hypothetical protein
MFMFRIDHKASSAFWLHDPKHSAPAAMKPKPDRRSLMAVWAKSRLDEEHRRDVDLSEQAPKPFYPIQLVMAVYPSRN